MDDQQWFFKYGSADTLKKKQAELSRLANGLLKQTETGIFSANEIAQLREAAKVLRGFKDKVEHEKEKKAREERRRENAINSDANTATTMLRSQVASLSLADQFRLATNNEDGPGNWPYGTYAGALEDLNRFGLEQTLRRLQGGLNQWTQYAGRSLAVNAHGSFNPEPVTAATVLQKINKAMNASGRIFEAVDLDQLLLRVEELQAIDASDNVVSISSPRPSK